MERSRLLYLIRRYSENTASPAELQELSDFIAKSPDDTLFTEVIMEQMECSPLSEGDMGAFEGIADRVLGLGRAAGVEMPAGGMEVVPMEPKGRYLRKWIWAAAACILLLASVGVLITQRKTGSLPAVAKNETAPGKIVPGRSGAILTLADGSTIALDSLGNGKIASQNGTDVFIRQGKLAYAIAGKAPGEMMYNTLSTPKGRQYHIQLPDGTEVWLNAASSIHYPTVFSDGERVVDVTGEAYFEVAKDAAHPFKVRIGKGAQIDVLGTHFNVNAYSNEPTIATTLLEGSVQFSAGDGRRELLRPGQQTQFDHASGALTVADDVETARVVAWKNGFFDFTDIGLKKVMQQLERWYDIDVVYEKNVPDIRFFGKMTKHIPLNDLLIILEKSKVHFRMEGRTLVVKP